MTRFSFVVLAFALTALSSAGVAEDVKPTPKPAGAPGKDDPAADDVNPAKVFMVFDPGSHTRPISAMAFTKDKSRLITVGQDHTIQIWNTATGERMDVIRLAGHGREKGKRNLRWSHAAVSPDGTKVAIGGDLMGFGDGESAKLLVVDVPTRTIRPMRPGAGGKRAEGSVTVLAFSPDGNCLAAGFDGGAGENPKRAVVVWSKLNQFVEIAEAAAGTFNPVVFETGDDKEISSLAFAPDSKRLMVGVRGPLVGVWEVGRGPKAEATRAAKYDVGNVTTALAWSPDGKQVARAYTGTGKEKHGVQLLDQGKPVKHWALEDLTPTFFRNLGSEVYTVQFLGANRVLLVGETNGFQGGGLRFGTTAGVLDLTAGTCTRLLAEESPGRFFPIGAVSADGTHAAGTVNMGGEAVVFHLADEAGKKKRPAPRKAGDAIARMGARTPVPTQVAWAANPKSPGFAWSDEFARLRVGAKVENLTAGFDLTTLEPVAASAGEGYEPARHKLGDWSLDFRGNTTFTASRGKQQLGSFQHSTRISTATLVPQGGNEPLVAWAGHGYPAGSKFQLSKLDGTPVAEFLPSFPFVHDVATSPDGRLVVAATGTHPLAIYTTQASQTGPLLYFAAANGEWALWTPQGYFTASPGGEKLLGWAVLKGLTEPMEFHPAARFAKQFRRPDVIKMTVEKGSVAGALAALNVKQAQVEAILPPQAILKLKKQDGARVRIEVKASSGVKDKPVVAMRVLLDGRPMPENRGVWKGTPAPQVSEVFEVDIPPGSHELKLMARSEDSPAISEPLIIKAPKQAGMQPTIHRVCVGINDYDSPGLKLNAAVKDATDVFEALEKSCVGPNNRFGAAAGEKILNQDATRDRVLQALATVRKQAKPGDLVVVFFAVHGVKQKDQFYLLTREANTDKDLKGAALSGEDLREALAGIECPVLLLLDACHSAAAVKNFRPATDEVARSLTDDSVGVTVMSAAMSHEVAGANTENGHFTAALLRALKAGTGVPFDTEDRGEPGRMYVHHVYAVVYGDVRRATSGKQNPFLNMPWTVPPIVIREVAEP